MVSSEAGKGTKDICAMRGIRESSYEVVMRFHLKLAKGRVFTGAGERKAKGQAVRNVSTLKRERASSGGSRGGARDPAPLLPPYFYTKLRPEKSFFETASPLFQGLDDPPPPPSSSEGLDPPLPSA